MRAMRAAAGVVTVLAVMGATEAAAAPPSEPEREVLAFLDISRLVTGPSGGEAQPGDTFAFANILRLSERSDAVTRQWFGRFPSTCTVVEGTQVDCTGTLQLRDGTIAVKGTPDLAVTPIDMVVTGGTGRYATVTGSAQLTPTDRQGTSRLTVYLERPAS